MELPSKLQEQRPCHASVAELQSNLLRNWHIVPTPTLTITGIDKERRTQGRVVLLSCEAQSVDAQSYGFLSQSLPTLVRWMNEGRTERRFMVSGFYRVMRKQQRTHHKWTAQCFDRTQDGIEALNAALAKFTSFLFIVRSPEAWRVNLPEGFERPPQQESESAPAETSLVDATQTGRPRTGQELCVLGLPVVALCLQRCCWGHSHMRWVGLENRSALSCVWSFAGSVRTD